MPRELSCGCRTCGCLCPQHSPSNAEMLCERHSNEAIARFIAKEAATLVALALFIAGAMVWCSILAAPGG